MKKIVSTSLCLLCAFIMVSSTGIAQDDCCGGSGSGSLNNVSSSAANAQVFGGNTTSGATSNAYGGNSASGSNAEVSGVVGGSAQISGVQGGQSQSQSSANIADIQGGSAQVSGVEGGSAQVSGVEGGQSQASANGGTASADVNGVQGIGSVNQVFEASTPPPYMPNSVTGPVISPNLFSIMGGTAQISGLPMLSNHFFSTTSHDVAIGNSKGTKIIYNGALLPKK